MVGSLGLSFLTLVIIGIPVSFALGISALIFLLKFGSIPLTLIPQRMFTGIDSFALMAIPFFILAGELMNASGIIHMLIRFSGAVIGRISGGLAHVNILSSMIFAGVSGSAVADASGIGAVLIPPMEKEYDIDFAVAVTASSAAIGPIIPPSIPMIIYALVGNVSIAGLFMAGVIPGILVGIGLMIISYILSRMRRYPVSDKAFNIKNLLISLKEGVWGLIMPILIIGGILTGIFTPTEAGAVGVVYALSVGFCITRKIKISTLPGIIFRTGIVSSVVLFLVATSNVVSWILTSQQVALHLSEFFKSVSPNPLIFLLIINAFLLIIGALIDLTPAIIMLTPVFAPIAVTYGIDPLHFGFIVVLNLIIGLLTPPVGTVLYAIVAVSGLSMERVVRAIFPFFMWEIIVLLGVTYIPILCLWLPKSLGY